MTKDDILDFREHPEECNRHAEDDTSWSQLALVSKVGRTSPLVCNCTRKLIWRGYPWYL